MTVERYHLIEGWQPKPNEKEVSTAQPSMPLSMPHTIRRLAASIVTLPCTRQRRNKEPNLIATPSSGN